MARYRIDPEQSQVWIEARSSLHPIHGEATGLDGELELSHDGRQLDVDAAVRMRVRLPVTRLASGNPAYDLAMRRVANADRYPAITGEASRVEPLDATRYRVTGEVTFHGVTRTETGEISIAPAPDTDLVIEGEHEFDITEYGVRPPKILMLRVYPEVRVRVRVVAQQIRRGDA